MAKAPLKTKEVKSSKKRIYIYKGTDVKGGKVSGEIEIATPALAKAHLQKQGIKVKSISRKLEISFGGGGIKPMDIAIFTRQLATMMKAGVPLVQAFEIVADGLENKAMASLVRELRDDVAAGGSLADALAKHPKYFDELFCNLVSSGEQSGALETMLDRVATYKEKSEALKSKIKKAMTYPIAVVGVAVIVTALLMVKVVPQFASIFSSFGAELPAFTLFVMSLSEWFQANWFIALVIIIVVVVAHKESSNRSKKYRDTIDAILLKAPVVGNIVRQSVFARFARTLSTTFAAGVPLVEALDSVAGAAGNEIYARAVRRVRTEVTSGTNLNVAMRAEGIFPGMMLQMTAIGEESGALDEMLDKVASFYEAEVDNSVDGLTSLMEPIIMSVLGVLVGGLMVAMYMPIFQLGSTI